MKTRVLTNNPTVMGALGPEAAGEAMFVEGLPKLLNKAMELLQHGWRLDVDPMGGYMSRPNPFHTMFLSPPDGSRSDPDGYLRDVTALDALLSRYWLNRELYQYHGATEGRRADHAAVDRSIALRSLERLG